MEQVNCNGGSIKLGPVIRVIVILVRREGSRDLAAMDDTATTFSYPPIDPTTFDVIIIGTGLPESILAAASSAAGKTVLHLDPNPFYGSHFSSLPLSDVPSFLLSHSHAVPLPRDDLATPSPSDAVLVPVDLTTRPVYSHIEISSHSHSTDLLEHSRKFNLDLAGPRVLFCADSAVDLMLKSGANQYVEFKNVDGTYVCGGDGKLSSVPDSRSAVFKDASLGLMEKNRLGSFFKLVEGHLKGTGSDGGRRISEEDLERPFVEFLDKIRLPTQIKSYRSNCLCSLSVLVRVLSVSMRFELLHLCYII